LIDALESVGVCQERISALKQRLADLHGMEVAPTPLISGDDLRAKGLKPGPIFKQILETVYDAQLEDRVKTRQEAIGLAMELSKRPASG